MKHALFFLLLGLSYPAISADFRLLNFGDSCEELVSRETAAGSQLTSAVDERYIFEGRHLNREASIIYQCLDGLLSRGTYALRFDDFATAKRFFLEQEPEFILDYGVPKVDQAAENYLDYMESIGFKIKDEHKYVLYWELETRNILFAATPPS